MPAPLQGPVVPPRAVDAFRVWNKYSQLVSTRRAARRQDFGYREYSVDGDAFYNQASRSVQLDQSKALAAKENVQPGAAIHPVQLNRSNEIRGTAPA